MFEALRCALKSNQPGVSGTNCNEEISENASSLASGRRCVLLWWGRREVGSWLSQAQPPGPLQVHANPCSLWVSGGAVGSWCEMLLVGVFCSSLRFPAPAERSTAARSPCDRGRIGGLPPNGKVVPLLSSACVCILKKKKKEKKAAGLCF